MESVLSQIKESAALNGINRISKVKIVVGQMTMAEPCSMRFAFKALTKIDEPFYINTLLEIEERPVSCKCDDCASSFAPPDIYTFLCPNCNSPHIEVTGGRELYLDYYEGESG